jgi:disulfide bond formation protein DsbB/thiol-disulfide isomerase/thioredoxin
MSTANLFFSLLTIATNIALVAMLVIVAANRFGKPVAALGRLREAALPLATAVATVSTLGSLYYSEIANLRPCVLCWYQRGAMYPLAVLLLVALFTQRRHLWRFAVPLSLIGAAIAGYHYMIQRNPAAAVEGVCSAEVPCTAVELWEFGFISMAYMALSAFLFVAAAMWFGVRPALDVGVTTDPAKHKGRKQPTTDEPGQEPREVVAPTVEGAVLPEFTDPANDPAAGQPLPVLTGTDYSGQPVTVSKDGAKVIMVMAHWCPHCQTEVPKIQQWLTDNGFPEGVALYSISSGAQANAPNYPPDAWLQRENWEVPVIADDEDGTARTSMGLSGYPFFVFVEFDGTVAYRHAGAMPIEEFAQRIEALQAGIAS